MNSNKVLVYSLATQHDNLGDLLINQQFIKWLQSNFNVVIEDKDVPDNFLHAAAGMHAIKASNSKSKYSIKSSVFYKSLLFSRPSIDGVVLSPGHFGDSSPQRDMKKLVVLFVSLFFRLKKISTYRVGISFGKMSVVGRFIESLTAFAFKLYAVRDIDSCNALFRFAHKQCVVIPDLSFLAFDEYATCSRQSNEVSDVLISFRGDRSPPVVSDFYHETLLTDIPQICSRTFKTISCYSQVKYDADFMKTICTSVSSGMATVSYHEEYADLDKATSLINAVDFVISNRLHVLLPAIMLGKLVIAVGTRDDDRKIFSIFKDIGIEGFFYDLDNIEKPFDEFISSIIADAASNRHKLLSSVSRVAQIVKQQLATGFDSVSEK